MKSTLKQILFSLFITTLALQSNAQTKSQSTKQELVKYNLTLNGQPSGNAESYTLLNKNNNTESHMILNIAIKRGIAVINLNTHSIYEENAKYETIKLSHKLAQSILGQQSVKDQSYTFNKKDVSLITKTSNQAATTSTLPRPDLSQITSPLKAQKLFANAIKNNIKEFTYTTLSAETGVKPATMATTIQGQEKITLNNKQIKAYKSTVISSIAPTMKITNYTDANGIPYITKMPVGPFNITLTRTNNINKKLIPAEVLVSSFIKPNKRIKHPRTLKKAIYKLTIDQKDNAAPLDLKFPRAASQKFVWANQNTILLHIDTTKQIAPQDDLPKQSHLLSSNMITANHKAVIDLNLKALRTRIKLTNQQKALKLKKFVYRHIQNKNLSAANATAAQTALSKSGDCTEHAVLLAALLRISKIPSRTVSGLVYADQFAGQKNIFGYHMWTQAWIDDDKLGGRWIDLDATLNTKFDATHIAISTSDQSDQNATTEDSLNLLPIIGKTKIQIIQTDYK